MIRRLRSPQSVDSRIHYAIRGKGHGSVFVPADFLDMGSREAVDVSLHRLARIGTIRRLATFDDILAILADLENAINHEGG
jgi:hypothetical protein